MIKTIFQGALKIGVAIVGAVLVLAVIGGVIAWGFDAYKKNQARPYEQVKQWEQDLTDPLQLKMRGKTKLVEEKMYAEFLFDGYPAYLTAQINRTSEAAGLELKFLDVDGFEIGSQKLKLSEALTIYDKGKPAGMRYAFEQYTPTDLYSRIHQVRVAWQLETEPPAPPRPVAQAPTPTPTPAPRPTPAPAPAPRPDARPTLEDHCAPNLSREERLRRLSQRGALRQTGEGSYTAGTGAVYFFQDKLLSCH